MAQASIPYKHLVNHKPLNQVMLACAHLSICPACAQQMSAILKYITGTQKMVQMKTVSLGLRICSIYTFELNQNTLSIHVTIQL